MLSYLSVHDLVWINSTLTGKNVPFNHETLEAAMASQYSYGNSTDVIGQAANLLNSLILKPPFDYGNRRTAFVAVSAYLNANGSHLKVDDAAAVEIIKQVENRSISAADAVGQLAADPEPGHSDGINIRSVVTQICGSHIPALQSLQLGDEPAA